MVGTKLEKCLRKRILLTFILISSLSVITGCTYQPTSVSSDIQIETEEAAEEKIKIDTIEVKENIADSIPNIELLKSEKSETAVNEVESVEKTARVDSVYTYTELKETLYITEAINIRSGPSLDYMVIGGYNKGAEAVITGICNETGWYRVDINGTVGYISSGNLTAEASTSGKNEAEKGAEVLNETVSVLDEIAARPVMCGRLYIPSQNINVAIFYGTYDDDLQGIVDNKDSAAFFQHETGVFIADHVNQAFANLKCIKVGDKMMIDYGSYAKAYTCVETASGYNGGSHLYYDDGTRVCDNLDGKLLVYTCKGSGITITLWQ